MYNIESSVKNSLEMLHVAEGFRRHSVPFDTPNAIIQFNLQTLACIRFRETESSIYQKTSFLFKISIVFETVY